MTLLLLFDLERARRELGMKRSTKQEECAASRPSPLLIR